MNEKQAVTLLEKMIRIPSPSTGEKKLAMFLKKEFSKKGFKTKIDKAGNFIATKGSGKPLLLLEAHMDTVLPVLPVKKSKGVLHGRGTVDTKSTLAAMLIAADNAKISKGTLTVAGVVEEESTSNKGALFLKSQIKPDYCIVGEPSSWNAISIGYKGTVSFAFEFTAKKTHSSMGMLAGNNFLNFFNELQTHYINEGIETGPSFNQLLIELRNADVDDEKTMAFVSLRLPLSIKAGDCISCHTDTTKPDSPVFAGGLGMRTPFGTFAQAGPCEHCGGEGKSVKNKCPECKGTGRLEKNKRFIEIDSDFKFLKLLVSNLVIFF